MYDAAAAIPVAGPRPLKKKQIKSGIKHSLIHLANFSPPPQIKEMPP